MLEIEKIAQHELFIAKSLIHKTINTCYPEIYPDEVVSFFINYHSTSEIRKRIQLGYFAVIKENKTIQGTGYLHGEELGGVYINPDAQRRGLGKQMVLHLLGIARKKKLRKIWLDATPIAKPLYDKLGFTLVSPMTEMVDNVPLDYFKMEMALDDQH